MKGKPGRDWGGARSKHSPTSLKKALEMRSKGDRLGVIAKATGLSPSYICKLTSKFLEHGRGRTAGITGAAAVAILRKKLAKLEAEARAIRGRIKLLTEEGHGKPKHPAKGRASAATPEATPREIRGLVRDVSEGTAQPPTA